MTVLSLLIGDRGSHEGDRTPKQFRSSTESQRRAKAHGRKLTQRSSLTFESMSRPMPAAAAMQYACLWPASCYSAGHWRHIDSGTVRSAEKHHRSVSGHGWQSRIESDLTGLVCGLPGSEWLSLAQDRPVNSPEQDEHQTADHRPAGSKNACTVQAIRSGLPPRERPYRCGNTASRPIC